VILAAGARRVGAPYPVFLAVGGARLAFLPGAPSFSVPPELALAPRRTCGARCGLRCVAQRSQGQLGASDQPGLRSRGASEQWQVPALG